MRVVSLLAVTLACAVAFAILSREASPLLRRTAFAAGALAIAMLLLLGALWPSLHTVVAVVCSPCLVLFAVGIVRPALASRRWVRMYGVFAVLSATVSWAVQAAHTFR